VGSAQCFVRFVRWLAIAHALLIDAPIVVFEEPTEGLDTVTEQALLASIMKLMAGHSILLLKTGHMKNMSQCRADTRLTCA
jgi:ABC-type transport system involved in cytochrome bd biosynthesis fused ATPase/permease subunit